MIERTDLGKYTSRQDLNIVFKRRGVNSTIEALFIVGETEKNVILCRRNRRRNGSLGDDLKSEYRQRKSERQTWKGITELKILIK